MKKLFYSTVCAAAVLLSGCSDTELAHVGSNTQNAIGFHVVGNKMNSRATIIDSENIKSTDFKVYAFTDQGNAFMGENDTQPGWNGINIKHDGTKWDYAQASDLRYWPEATPLNFYAVNPGTFEEGSFAEGMENNCMWTITHNEQQILYVGSDTYNTEKKNPANIDLMYAIAKGKTYANTNGTVKMQFRHILSQVVFKAKTKYDDMEVEINGMKFHNFQLGGTKIQITKKDIATDISTNKPLLFIPQVLTAWKTSATSAKTKKDGDDAKESYLEISCRIKQKGEYVFGKDGFNTLYVPFGASWEPGMRYSYTLIFGGGYNDQGLPILNPVSFEAAASKWTDETEGNVTL